MPSQETNWNNHPTRNQSETLGKIQPRIEYIIMEGSLENTTGPFIQPFMTFADSKTVHIHHVYKIEGSGRLNAKSCFILKQLPPLKLTFFAPENGWLGQTIRLPFGAGFGPVFRGENVLVSGRVYILE